MGPRGRGTHPGIAGSCPPPRSSRPPARCWCSARPCAPTRAAAPRPPAPPPASGCSPCGTGSAQLPERRSVGWEGLPELGSGPTARPDTLNVGCDWEHTGTNPVRMGLSPTDTPADPHGYQCHSREQTGNTEHLQGEPHHQQGGSLSGNCLLWRGRVGWGDPGPEPCGTGWWEQSPQCFQPALPGTGHRKNEQEQLQHR